MIAIKYKLHKVLLSEQKFHGKTFFLQNFMIYEYENKCIVRTNSEKNAFLHQNLNICKPW